MRRKLTAGIIGFAVALIGTLTVGVIHTEDPPTIRAEAIAQAPANDQALTEASRDVVVDELEVAAFRYQLTATAHFHAYAAAARRLVDAQEAQEAAQAAAAIAPAPTSTAPASGSCGVLPASICAGESGFNPNAYNATGCDGRGCFGKYQFDPRTWAGAGCPGHPSGASEATQDACAAKVWNGGAGCSHWNAC